MATVLTVLRSGGEFEPSHVRAMQRMVAKHAPHNTRFVCLSDVDIEGVETIELKWNLPGWWSKLEMFRPDVLPREGFLFTDLDNVITGPIGNLINQGPYFVQQRKGWTALMHIPRNMGARARVWDDFKADPASAMDYYKQCNRPIIQGLGNYGDAGFITDRLPPDTKSWDEVAHGEVSNIAFLWHKPYIGPKTFKVPPSCRVLLLGQPYRPWKMPEFKHLYEET